MPSADANMPVTRQSGITLYTALTSNGIKVSIALEELGLKYKAVEVNLASNEQKEAWFLKVNPNGRIPAITDDGQRIFESGSLLIYLTEKYDKSRLISYESGSKEYYEQLSWLMFQMGGIGPMQGWMPTLNPRLCFILTTRLVGQANHFRLMAGEYSEYGINRYMNETKRLYSVLNTRLECSPYLAGDKYTIADIASFAWVRYGPIALEIDLSEFPALKKWHDKITKRPAVQKGLKVPKALTEEQLVARYRAMKEKMEAMKAGL